MVGQPPAPNTRRIGMYDFQEPGNLPTKKPKKKHRLFSG
jgi:hypothetical protein